MLQGYAAGEGMRKGRKETERSGRKTGDDQGGGSIDRLAYVPRFNQSLLKTLSFARGGPSYLSFSLFFISRTRGIADNEMERNANRIAPASEIH